MGCQSWATDEKVAHWFAKRFNAGTKVHSREITRDSAVCYLKDRSEKEIILLEPDTLPKSQQNPQKYNEPTPSIPIGQLTLF
jgi:hypothetical protein